MNDNFICCLHCPSSASNFIVTGENNVFAPSNVVAVAFCDECFDPDWVNSPLNREISRDEFVTMNVMES